MQEKFKVESNITKDMIYEIGTYIFKDDIFKERLLLGIVGPILLIVIILYFGEINIKVILLAVVEIILICKMKSLTGYLYFKKNKLLMQTQTILFGGDSLKVKYEAAIKDVNIKYSEIEKVSETEKWFLFTIDEWCLWFDKQSFIVGDLDEFRCFIKEKLNSSSVKLK